jgi:hypothetical protein
MEKEFLDTLSLLHPQLQAVLYIVNVISMQFLYTFPSGFLFQVKLERVLGLTVSSNAALDCDPETEVVAYPAG